MLTICFIIVLKCSIGMLIFSNVGQHFTFSYKGNFKHRGDIFLYIDHTVFSLSLLHLKNLMGVYPLFINQNRQILNYLDPRQLRQKGLGETDTYMDRTPPYLCQGTDDAYEEFPNYRERCCCHVTIWSLHRSRMTVVDANRLQENLAQRVLNLLCQLVLVLPLLISHPVEIGTHVLQMSSCHHPVVVLIFLKGLGI